MNIMGFSSGVVGRESNVDRMVKAVLDKSGGDNEFVKLTDLTYSGCKGCVDVCAEPQACLLQDDLLPYYRKIREADVVVTVAVAGKPFIAIACGHRKSQHITERIERRLGSYRVKLVDIIEYSSKAPPYLSCGRHRECSIGGLYSVMGEEAHSVVVSEEMFCRWEDDSEAVGKVDEATAKLRAVLEAGTN